jgi:hypothetical protein
MGRLASQKTLWVSEKAVSDAAAATGGKGSLWQIQSSRSAKCEWKWFYRTFSVGGLVPCAGAHMRPHG